MTERLPTVETKEIPGILRIGVDLDGIVCDVESIIREQILNNLGFDIRSVSGPVPYWIPDWPQIKVIPGGPEYVNKIFNDSYVIENVSPIDGAISALNRFHLEGHKIWFVTARHSDLRELTLAWLEKNGLPWASSERVIFRDGDENSAEFKRQTSVRFRFNIFLDDCAQYIRPLDNPELWLKLLLKYQWNMGEEIGTGAKICQDWEEISQIIDNLSSWHFFLNT